MKSCFLFFLILNTIFVFSQERKREYTIGITNHNIDYLETDFNLNFGYFYKKNYSQVNLIYAVGVHYGNSGGIWNVNKNVMGRSGIGYTHRYFPNKKYSLFTSFIEANISYLSIHANTINYGFDSINNTYIPKSIRRNILNCYLGYGVGLNIFHHFTVMTSVAGGYSFVGGENQYFIPNIYTEGYHLNETFLQLNFSALYHFRRF